jgi:phosphatidylglycerophosphate synthase
MFDGIARGLVTKPLDRAGKPLADQGITANAMTFLGLILGLGCVLAIIMRWDILALALLGLNRIADGLDGAIARASVISVRGGFLDITFDFIFYGSIPLAFALRDPQLFALPAAILLASFYANGASFLAYAAAAAELGMKTKGRGVKSLYYTAGLVEGSETIAFFVAFILFPHLFPILAYVFAGLCLITCMSRILLGWRVFDVDGAHKS